MNKIKCVCISSYGWTNNGIISYNIGDIIEIKINEAGRITNFIDKNGKNFIFMSSEEIFYKCFKPLAEMRNEKIDQILDDN